MVFLDLETTGVNVQNDRIVEISILKLLPDGTKESKTRRLNPEMHIPEGATKIHGIKDEDVASEPTFKAISKNLYIYLEGCDLGGYNIFKFDLPVLVNEFARAGLEFSIGDRRVVDPYLIFCQMESRSLTAAYKFYCGKNLENAHSAEADVTATLEILEGQLKKYESLPPDIAGLYEFCNPAKDWLDSTGKFKWQDGEAVVAFGKNNGMTLKKISEENPGFLKWIINSDFPEDVKKIASDALRGELPKRNS